MNQQKKLIRKQLFEVITPNRRKDNQEQQQDVDISKRLITYLIQHHQSVDLVMEVLFEEDGSGPFSRLSEQLISLPKLRQQRMLELKLQLSMDDDNNNSDSDSELDVDVEPIAEENDEFILSGDFEGGYLYTCGRSSNFTLGYESGGQAKAQQIPRKVPMPMNNVESVACGKDHTLFLTRDGLVFGFGAGSLLGLGSDFAPAYVSPIQISKLYDIGVINCGDGHSMVISFSGTVLSWGKNEFGQCGVGNDADSVIHTPTRVRLPDKDDRKASAVACGERHSLIISRELGAVYSFGSDEDGALGIATDLGGSTSKRRSHGKPRRIEGLNKVFATKCAAAAGISMILTKQGEVYQWGLGMYEPYKVLFPVMTSSTSTGFQRKTSFSSPSSSFTGTSATTISSNNNNNNNNNKNWISHQSVFENDIIVDIACASDHRAYVSSKGKLFTCGTHAQTLGHTKIGSDRPSHVSTPTLVACLEGFKIVQVACAKFHTVALDESGRAFTWGLGGFGTLGHPNAESYQPTPKMISSLRRITRVAAGKAHTAFVMSDNRPKPSSIYYSSLGEPIMKSRILPLYSLAETQVMKTVTPFNVIQIFQIAEQVCSQRLRQFCQDYILENLDIILVLHPGIETAFVDLFPDLLSSSEEEEEEEEEELDNFERKYSNVEDSLENSEMMPFSFDDEDQQQFQLPSTLSRNQNEQIPEFEVFSHEQLTSMTLDQLRTLSRYHEQYYAKNDQIIKEAMLPTVLEQNSRICSILTSFGVYCEVCKVQVSNKAGMTDHLLGKRHQKEMQKRGLGIGKVSTIQPQQQLVSTSSTSLSVSEPIQIHRHVSKQQHQQPTTMSYRGSSTASSIKSGSSPVFLSSSTSPVFATSMKKTSSPVFTNTSQFLKKTGPVKTSTSPVFTTSSTSPVFNSSSSSAPQIDRKFSLPGSASTYWGNVNNVNSQSQNLLSQFGIKMKKSSDTTSSLSSVNSGSYSLKSIVAEQESKGSKSSTSLSNSTTNAWGLLNGSISKTLNEVLEEEAMMKLIEKKEWEDTLKLARELDEQEKAIAAVALSEQQKSKKQNKSSSSQKKRLNMVDNIAYATSNTNLLSKGNNGSSTKKY